MALQAPKERSVDNILRSSRDGSRWRLWRVQQEVTAGDDVAPQAAEGAAALVQEFHATSEGVEDGRGSFGFKRFDRIWRQEHTHNINTVMHAQLCALARHPVGHLIRMLDTVRPETVYDRTLAVLGLSTGPCRSFEGT